MTTDIAIVLVILGVAVILFITEAVRMDIVALMVMVSLVFTGLVTPQQAVSGFSNPAVITVWAVLILSAGLARTGVAAMIGNRVMKLPVKGEGGLLSLIMIPAGVLSGFMASIGVASLFLPVVIDITRQTRRQPSRMLIPLAYAAMLGGLLTLIGTPSNLLLSEVLSKAGFAPFRMFQFTPTGLTLLVCGVLFMALIGRRLLPRRDIAREYASSDGLDTRQLYDLQERMFILRLPENSTLDGKTLAESRLGSVLGLSVIAILRNGHTELAPKPAARLQSCDQLLIEGHPDRIQEVIDHNLILLDEQGFSLERLVSGDVELRQVELTTQSNLVGRTLRQSGFRRVFGVVVLAIHRDEVVFRTNLENIPLHAGDDLLVQGHPSQFEHFEGEPGVNVSTPESIEDYHLEERLMVVHLPSDSPLVGKSLVESHLGDAFGLGVMGIIRQGVTELMPDPDAPLQAGDILMVKGKKSDLQTITGLQTLSFESQEVPDIGVLESEEIGMVEAVLSPHTPMIGKTLRELNFRARYGLSVLAIWRQGRAYRSNLRQMPLAFGDALLLYGPRQKIMLLGNDTDLIVLTEDAQLPPKTQKAPLAALIMLGVLLPVMLGWMRIEITAIAGVCLMVLTSCLTMEEAYRAIDWRAIFLIAGMLPLGIAMQETGAASLIANSMLNWIGGYGPQVVLAGLFILSALATQFMPNPAVAVLMAPVALNTAQSLGVSPYPYMMTIAVSVSAVYLSPVGHAINLLVMGPGGYRFTDYFKAGLPLLLLVMAVSILVIPIFLPF